MDAGQVGGAGQTELAGDRGEPGPGPQPREHRGAGQGGGVAESLRAPGPGQGVGDRHPAPETRAEHRELTLGTSAHRRGCAGARAGGPGSGARRILPHPLRILVEVWADDEAQLGPGAHSPGAPRP